MSNDWPWAAMVGALAAYLLNQGYNWQRNGEKSRALLRGIMLEIEHAEQCAKSYVIEYGEKIIWSPAYRLATDFLKEGLVTLSEHGVLRHSDLKSLHLLFICAGEANRCLDQLAPLVEIMASDYETKNRAAKETSRVRIKLQRVLDAIPKAREVTSNSLERLAWYEPQR